MDPQNVSGRFLLQLLVLEKSPSILSTTPKVEYVSEKIQVASFGIVVRPTHENRAHQALLARSEP